MRVGVSPQGGRGAKRGFMRRGRGKGVEQGERERRKHRRELRGRDSVGNADGETKSKTYSCRSHRRTKPALVV